MKGWKLHLFATALAEFMCVAGWYAAVPFMPLYVRTLGISDLDQVAVWSGLLSAASPVVSLFVMPIWGVLADRKGHKWNSERAAFGIALTFILMALAGNVEQLFAVRLLQGALAGITPAAIGLAAALVPQERIGLALGLIMMTTNAGCAIGPLAGGWMADQVGYRWTFAMGGVLSIVSGVLLMILVSEKRERPETTVPTSGIVKGAQAVLRSTPVFGAILIMAGAHLADSAGRVVLPLFVDALQGNPTRVNSATGLVLGGMAMASAVSSLGAGRLTDRVGYRSILLGCAVGTGLSFAAMAAAPRFGLLLAAAMAMGLFFGGLITEANAVLARMVSRTQQGVIYGLSSSANSAGNTVGPLIGAAAASAWGMRSTFAMAALLFAMIAVITVATIQPLQHRQTIRLHYMGLRLPDSFFRHHESGNGSAKESGVNRERDPSSK